MVNKNKFAIPPLLEDFNEFSYMLTQLNHPDFGGKEVWAAEIDELDTLRQDALKFMQWKTNPDLEGTRVRVAVIGDFSAGKSSFINSLLGELFCPVKVEPSTSSITTFKYGDKKQIFLLHPESSEDSDCPQREEIELKKYEQLVCHQGGSGLRYEFEVFYPFSGFQDIELYDTPGFGNVKNEDDERITLAKCAEADAILFVFDINRGNLGEDMRIRLQAIKDKTPELRICAILNKSDQKSRSVVNELCEVWKDEGVFEEVIAYSSKREMLQFSEKKTDLAGFSLILSKTVMPCIVRQLNGDIFYKLETAELSNAQSLVMAQLTSIQNSKQKIIKKKRSKEFWDYLKKRKSLPKSIVKKTKQIFIDSENEQNTTPLKDTLLSSINAEKTCAQISELIESAVFSALTHKKLTNDEKPYVFTPYWSASFSPTQFSKNIKSSNKTKEIQSRFKNFFDLIPNENYQYVENKCSELKNYISNLNSFFSSTADEIKLNIPEIKDSFENYKEIVNFRNSLQGIAIEHGKNIFAEKIGALADEIISHLEKCQIFDLGSKEIKDNNAEEFISKINKFTEKSIVTRYQKNKFTYA